MLYSVFKQAARTSVRNMVARRQASASSSQQQQQPFVKAERERHAPGGFKKTWLSDPSTYPLILVVGAAFAMIAGTITSCLLYSPDVQINPKIRNSIIRPYPKQGNFRENQSSDE